MLKSLLAKIEVFRSGATAALLAFLDGIVPEAKVVPELTYPEVIRYFVNDRPDDDRIAKGSILVQEGRFGKLTIWTFLDAENNVVCDTCGNPYGRKLIAKRFDDELLDAFGDTSMLIIN